MVAYSDTFAGSGALGVTEVGGLAWEAIVGSWSRTNGYAATATAASSNPMAVVDVGVGQVDISLAVSSGGGDALYFRVVDANNWLRARVRKWQTNYSYTEYEWRKGTSYTNTYTEYEMKFQLGASGDQYANHSHSTWYTYWTRSASGGNPSNTSHTHDEGIHTHTATNAYYTGATRTGEDSGTTYNYYWSQSNTNPPVSGATLTGDTRQQTGTNTNYSVVLEKCVGGVITELGTYGSSATSLRVRADGSSVQVFVNGTSRISVTEAAHQAATKHGLGKAASEMYGSALDNFSVELLIPPTPVIVAPANNSTIGTGTPGLQADAKAWGNALTKVEYQVAEDSAFSVGLKAFIEPDSYFRISGTKTLNVTEANLLTQRGWYIRARQVSETGLAGNWTAANFFTVAHSPGAINLKPTNGGGIILGATNRLEWDFTDTSTTDSQTAYHVIVERNDTGALVVDTGKITSTDEFYDLTIDPALKNVQLRWKVKVWDEEDKPSSFTNYALFIPTDAPTVTIVEPLDGGNVGTSRPLVRWVFAASGGRSQSYYRVTVTLQGGASPLYDSGQAGGQTGEHEVQSPIIENAKTYEITVYVTDSYGITVSDTSIVNAVYEEPDVVDFEVDDSLYEEYGYVRLTWQAENDPTFRRWRVYRRRVGDQNWQLLSEISQLTVTEYRDWLVPSMTTYDYYVVQVVERFNEEVESVVGQTVRLALGTGGYWLIDPVNHGNNMRLHNVTDEEYTDMHEQSEYLIVGRGRHVDEGEAIGKSGTMTAQLRDTASSTAREKKNQLEALRKRKMPVYLRNPFGDIWYIALGNIGVTRISGVGSSEFVDVSVPYLEVF